MAMTRGKKILVGCLAGMAIMVLAVILAVVFFVSWIRSPGPELEGRRLVHEHTDLYAELKLRREDEAVRDLLRVFLRARNRNAVAEIERKTPPALERLLPLFQNLSRSEVSKKDLDKILPMSLMVTSSKDESGTAPPLFAINLPGAGHILTIADLIYARAIGSRSDGLLVRWRGDEALYRTDTDPQVWLTIVDTAVLLSTSEEAVASGIELLRRPLGAITGTPLQSLLDEAPADATLTVAARQGGAGTLLALTAEYLPALVDMLNRNMKPQAHISAWARLESRDRLAGRLLVTNSSTVPDRPEEAKELSTYTVELMDGAVRLTLVDRGLDSAARHEWEFTLEGLESLARWAAVHTLDATISIGP